VKAVGKWVLVSKVRGSSEFFIPNKNCNSLGDGSWHTFEMKQKNENGYVVVGSGFFVLAVGILALRGQV
jgi:hypothetical protein